ncbi:unnamed protein product [Closterium sp. NIES-64]|nr:unnamed protein product [Closterium sp. NIES-64]
MLLAHATTRSARACAAHASRTLLRAPRASRCPRALQPARTSAACVACILHASCYPRAPLLPTRAFAASAPSYLAPRVRLLLTRPAARTRLLRTSPAARARLWCQRALLPCAPRAPCCPCALQPACPAAHATCSPRALQPVRPTARAPCYQCALLPVRPATLCPACTLLPTRLACLQQPARASAASALFWPTPRVYPTACAPCSPRALQPPRPAAPHLRSAASAQWCPRAPNCPRSLCALLPARLAASAPCCPAPRTPCCPLTALAARTLP